MLTKNLKISDIEIGPRHRKDFGDIDGLVANIKENGLLQPIGVTRDNVLIFGQRRLMAINSLKWETIPCSILDIESIVIGEHTENEMRKDFTMTERDAIRREIEKHIIVKKGGAGGGTARSSHLAGSNSKPSSGQDTADFTAKKSGLSSEQTARRVRFVVEHGIPELQKAMDDGVITPNKAAATAKLPADMQKDVLSGKTKLTSRKGKPKEVKGPPQRPDLKSPKTISEIAAYIKAWVANGEKLDKACASCSMGRAEYQRAKLVVEFGNKELIKAMDEELVTLNAAREAIKKPDSIHDLIEKARYEREKKKHKTYSFKGKPKPELLLDLLGMTYTYWSGAESNLPINSATIPSDIKRRSEVARHCKNIRRIVTTMLDKIEKEMEKCSSKTAE